MHRRDALLRLHKTVLERWTDLKEKLADELANLHDFRVADYSGDSADVAFETSSDEMSSQLAELDSRELDQVERALASLKEGTYGLCEGDGEDCQRMIPISRLNALPYTTLCINCEREMEQYPDWIDQRGADNWAGSSTRKQAWNPSGSISPNGNLRNRPKMTRRSSHR